MREGVGMRVRRFITLVGMIAAITMGVVVTERLSEDALAMLIGLILGVVLMVPLAGVGLLLWRREAQTRTVTTPQNGAPPVIVVTSGALPARYEGHTTYLAPSPVWPPERTERAFTVLGDMPRADGLLGR